MSALAWMLRDAALADRLVIAFSKVLKQELMSSRRPPNSFPTWTSSGFPTRCFQADDVLKGVVADKEVDATVLPRLS